MSLERAPAPRRGTARKPALRLLPGTRTQAARAPFVMLVLAILGIGLLGLLLLNTTLQQASFDLDKLRQDTTELRDRNAVLVQQLSERNAPDRLARSARELGMTPTYGAPKVLKVKPSQVQD